MNDQERERFDEIFEDVYESLPIAIRRLLNEVAVIVEDYPAADVLEEFRNPDGTLPERDEICGLHSGFAFTERTVEAGAELPPDIHVYREGIVAQAGGWDQPGAEEQIAAEIEITLLHEIGHQFGLDEDDLARLGYD
ncbi:MAG: metallopeptidase family protein [Phycisphaeraceae bacterium]|nr:metallopeptidase family protein [Phycisphaeraceae bacterium]MBX3408273.1 metallopeptidase family protein [Phycisphaeraceae bacterium]